jgi:hypothetical protein
MREGDQGVKNLTLTERDVEQFAAAARHALALFAGQYALIRPKFPTVTDEAVEAMIACVKADPHGTPKQPGIDQAVYFAALYTMTARALFEEIEVLPHHPDTVAVLQSIFMRIPACANSVNAFTLESRGGLMTELHADEAKKDARSKVAKDAADKRHAKMNEAKAWVRNAWLNDSHEYESKTDFAKIFAARVQLKFGLKVKLETITDKWLNSK